MSLSQIKSISGSTTNNTVEANGDTSPVDNTSDTDGLSRVEAKKKGRCALYYSHFSNISEGKL